MNLKSKFYLSNAYYKALDDPKEPRELADQLESESTTLLHGSENKD